MRETFLLSAAFILLQIHIFSRHSGEPLKPLDDVMLPGLEGPLGHLAADVKGQRIFLAATSKNTIEVYSAQGLKHLATIPGLAQPQDLVFVPESGNLLVTNAADGSLRTYDGNTLKLLDSKLMGGDADRLWVAAGGKTVYVGWGVGALAVFDMQSGRRSDIKLHSHPESFQLDSTGNRIFVNLPGVDEIAEVDRRSQTVFATSPVHPYHDNGPMALDESNRRLFVVCRRPAKLLAINMDDASVMATMSTVGDAADAFYDRERKRIYVVGGDGSIDVYRQKGPDEYPVVSHTETIPGARTGIFVPEWNRIYVVARNRPPFDAAELLSFSAAAN
jgi:DNA-binding beta-propeller fold protein YncE